MRYRSGLIFAVWLSTLPILSMGADTPRPIPVEQLFNNPLVSGPRLSPDRTRIAAVYSKEDSQIVFVSPLENSGEMNPIAQAGNDEIRIKWIWWANNETLFLSGTIRNPNAVGVRARSSRLFSIPASGGKLKWLGKRWPVHGQGAYQTSRQDGIVHDLPDEPGHVLMEYYGPKGMSIKRMNVTKGNLRAYHPPRLSVSKWKVDENAKVRAGLGVNEDDEYFVVARKETADEFHETIRVDRWDEDGPRFAGFSADPGVIYVFAPLDRRDAIFEWNVETNGPGKLVFANERVDVNEPVYGDDRSNLIGVRYIDDISRIHFLDPAYRQFMNSLEQVIRESLGDQVEIFPLSETRDKRLRIFHVSGPTEPPVYYYYDLQKQKLSVFFQSRPDIDRDRLSAPRSISYTARDGLKIPAYLTLPKGYPEKDLPVIVMPHGGPWARDWMQWSPEVQLFASRGYAVFQPNFRGSTGYGYSFLQSGYKEWGFAIQDDITDGVNWLVEKGIANPERIGIYGASFGAYAAMMGLVKTPGLYKAGAGYAGVYDIESMIDDDQWYGNSEDWYERVVGRDSERLRTASPRRRAGEISVPVLLAHGEDDERASMKQSRKMRDALEKEGKSVEYMEFENEVHGFLFEANRIRFYTRLIEFFDTHLARDRGADSTVETPAARP